MDAGTDVVTLIETACITPNEGQEGRAGWQHGAAGL